MSDALDILTMPQQGAISELVGQHGTVQYLMSVVEDLLVKQESLQQEVRDLKSALEERLFSGKRKALLAGTTASILFPTTALREIRKYAKIYIEETANDGQGARAFKDTAEILVDLADPYFANTLQTLNATPTIVKEKIREALRKVRGILPKPYHRTIMGWDNNRPYSVIIPLD